MVESVLLDCPLEFRFYAFQWGGQNLKKMKKEKENKKNVIRKRDITKRDIAKLENLPPKGRFGLGGQIIFLLAWRVNCTNCVFSYTRNIGPLKTS